MDSVNPNHAEINAAGEFDDPDSVYSFYKQLVALRHNSPVVAAGDWRLIDAADPHVYAFTRELDAEKLLVVVNMSSRTVDLPREAAELTAVGIAEPNVVISTYDAPHTVASLANRELDPWEQPSSSCSALSAFLRSKRYFGAIPKCYLS
mgnify:FL=1